MSVLTPPEAPTVRGSTPLDRRRATAWTLTAVGAITVSAVLISVFAKDMITGAFQDHLALPAILTWIWAVIAARSVATAVIRRRRSPDVGALARLLAIGVVPIWAAAAAVGIYGPELVTGSDPTHMPIAAIVAPIAAMVLTQVLGQVVTALKGDDEA